MESLHPLNPALSLLIVEDDTVSRNIILLMLTHKLSPGAAIHYAENGKLGVNLFREHAPEIVITDIKMPEMDGIQMIREIKKIKADTKFIVITGHCHRKYLNEFGETGISAYIVKPVIFEKLFAAIDRCIKELTPVDFISQEIEQEG